MRRFVPYGAGRLFVAQGRIWKSAAVQRAGRKSSLLDYIIVTVWRFINGHGIIKELLAGQNFITEIYYSL